MDRQHKVLIVDIEPVIANTLAKIFSLDGYETKAVYATRTAIDLSNQWHPDLAILDMLMDDMRGTDCAIEMSVQSPDCKFILYAQIADELIYQARDLHMAVFKKPLDPSVLLAASKTLFA